MPTATRCPGAKGRANMAVGEPTDAALDNPPGLFRASVLGRRGHHAQASSTTPDKLLEAACRLHTVEATGLAVLDLTTPEAREAVGLEDHDIYGEDWSACQAVGHATWFLHVQGILVPAAGGVGLVITAYEQRTRPGQLHIRHSEDLTPACYQELRHP